MTESLMLDYVFLSELILSLIQIDGPCGKLEGIFEPGTGSRCAVLCHPHPLYGGSMHDLVLEAIATGMRSGGIGTLRFNFRGVGQSAGSHDEGRGEVDDVLAAIDWIRQETSPDDVILSGYSFGAALALASAERSAADRLVLVAPPVTMMKGLKQPDLPAQVLLGSADQIVDAEKACAWFGDSAAVELIEGADHFFSGCQSQITSKVADYLAGS